MCQGTKGLLGLMAEKGLAVLGGQEKASRTGPRGRAGLKVSHSQRKTHGVEVEGSRVAQSQ